MFEINLIFLGLLSIYDSFSNKIKERKHLIFYILLYLIFFDGLRFETGTDWKSYYNYFYYGTAEEIYEIGFKQFIYVIKLLTNNYSIFLLIYSSIYYYFVFFKLSQKNNYNIITIFLLYSSLTPMLGAMRQFLALSIIVYSINYIFKKKFYKFILCILIASLFHSSAWLFLPAYYLNKKLSIKKIILFLLLSIIIRVFFKTILINSFLFNYIPMKSKVLLYINHKDNIVTNIQFITNILKKLCIILIGYKIYKKFNVGLKEVKLQNKFNFYLNCLYFGIFINIASYGVFQTLVSRGNIYYSTIFECIYLGFVLNLIPLKRKYTIYRLVLLIFCLFLGTFNFYKGISNYPNIFKYKNVILVPNISPTNY